MKRHFQQQSCEIKEKCKKEEVKEVIEIKDD